MARRKKIKRSWTKHKLILSLVGVLIVANFFLQIIRKPIEIISINPFVQPKTLQETWNSYSKLFLNHAYRQISPSLLAALVQVESSGDPHASPEWTWRWTTDLTRLYSPASSAFGLMQLTRPTLEAATKLCKMENRIVRTTNLNDSCPEKSFVARFVPSHSIALGSLNLGYHVYRILQLEKKKKISKTNINKLASIVHLCGYRKGRLFVRSDFKFKSRKLKRCGSHNTKRYVRQVLSLEKQFRNFITPRFEASYKANSALFSD